MTVSRDTERPPAGEFATRRRHRPAGATARASAGVALAALSHAGDAAGPKKWSSSRPPTRRQWWLAICASAAIGTAVFLSWPVRSRCVATFELTGDLHRFPAARYRTELSQHTWDTLRNAPDTDRSSLSWSLEAPTSRVLRLSIFGAAYDAAQNDVRNLADSFCPLMDAVAKRVRTTPSDAERILSQQTIALQERLADLQQRPELDGTHSDQTDPEQDRAEVVTRWDALRSDYAATRGRLDSAIAEAAALRAQTEPTHAIASADERREAMAADAALQQDLRELTVRLTELRVHLLDVWQQSGAELETLQSSSGEFQSAVNGEWSRPHDADVRDALGALAAYADQYQERLTPFAGVWIKEFADLRGIEVDALSSELLDAQERGRSLLHEFLFHAGKTLGTMRTTLRELDSTADNPARMYALKSRLTRLFRTVQQAHHRFEFAAGVIEPAGNFRLDAALQGARGLRRRSQLRIRRIDEELQVLAAERARKQRKRDLSETELLIERTRSLADGVVAELLTVQADLNSNAEETQSHLRTTLTRDLITMQIEQTQRDLSATQQQAGKLAADRIAKADAIGIRLIACDIVDAGAQGARFAMAGLGALLTLFVVRIRPNRPA